MSTSKSTYCYDRTHAECHFRRPFDPATRPSTGSGEPQGGQAQGERQHGTFMYGVCSFFARPGEKRTHQKSKFVCLRKPKLFYYIPERCVSLTIASVAISPRWRPASMPSAPSSATRLPMLKSAPEPRSR